LGWTETHVIFPCNNTDWKKIFNHSTVRLVQSQNTILGKLLSNGVLFLIVSTWFPLSMSFPTIGLISAQDYHLNLRIDSFSLWETKDNFNTSGSALQQSTTNESFLSFCRLWSITYTVLGQCIVFICVFINWVWFQREATNWNIFRSTFK